MKKIFYSLLVLFIFGFIYSSSVSAVFPLRKEIGENIRKTIQNSKEASLSPQQIREEVKERLREEKQGLIEKIKSFVKKNLKFKARIKGTIELISDNSITVKGDDGKTYLVNITSQTRLIRRFGGKSELGEFSQGDAVNVFGKFTDENETTINAFLIRNLSIQKRWGAFFGKVIQKNNDNFVMETGKRGNQTVYFAKAKLINRRQEAISYDEIQVGHRVRVKGVWDKSLNKIVEVDEVKDFSLPPLPTRASP